MNARVQDGTRTLLATGTLLCVRAYRKLCGCQAYDTLHDPEKRKIYDNFGQQGVPQGRERCCPSGLWVLRIAAVSSVRRQVAKVAFLGFDVSKRIDLRICPVIVRERIAGVVSFAVFY